MRPSLRSWLLAAAVLTTALLLPGSARAASEGSWIHVRVHEAGSDGAKVAVNLPIALVDVALGSIQNEKLRHGKIHIEDTELTVADLRAMWKELRRAGDVELVRIEKTDSLVRVERKGKRVLVLVSEKDGKKTPKVRIDVPISVVDALLEGEGDELNLKGAVSELRRTTSGEFITVEDDKSHVRVWIDDKPDS